MKISKAEATLVNLVGSLRHLVASTPDDRALGRWLLENSAGLKQLHRCKPDILAFIGGELPIAVSIPVRRKPAQTVDGKKKLKLVKGKKR